MSFLGLDAMKSRPWPPVATGVTAGILLVGLGDLVLGGWLAQALGLFVGHGSLEFWRPITFALVSGGLLSMILAAVFGYWILSASERMLGSQWTALVSLSSVLAVAAVCTWAVPVYGIIGGASLLGWGVIAASTYRVWRSGGNVRDQLVILALCLLMSMGGGAGIASLLMTVAAAAGGIIADILLHEVSLAAKPEDPYEAFVRARQGRPAPTPPSSRMLVVGLCVLLWAICLLRAFVG